MPKQQKKTWSQFKAKWKGCVDCQLCEVRQNIVLAKGQIPCDVLFIGEAPGMSEDVSGIPFDGPAGTLLHQILDRVMAADAEFPNLRIAFTNLVCCIPKESKGRGKVSEPPKESIQKCYNRLQEFVDLCKPKLLVFVGKLAEKHGSTLFIEHESVSITHPAAILRDNVDKLSIQRVFVQLVDAFTELEM